jgi:hypothetical protein
MTSTHQKLIPAFGATSRRVRDAPHEIREINQPDDWQSFDTRSLLGSALAGQKKFVEAEPLLVSGYEGMKHRGRN